MGDTSEAGSDGAPFTDGNILAGPLREIFAVDLMSAVGRCAGCGRVDAVASLRVYSRAPGLVARCPGCDGVILRLVRVRDDAWLDLRGCVSLRIPIPAASDPPSTLDVGALAP